MKAIHVLAKVLTALAMMACISAAILYVPGTGSGSLTPPTGPATTIERLLVNDQSRPEACLPDEPAAVITLAVHSNPIGRPGCKVRHVTY